jgi:hypothetical protein
MRGRLLTFANLFTYTLLIHMPEGEHPLYRPDVPIRKHVERGLPLPASPISGDVTPREVPIQPLLHREEGSEAKQAEAEAHPPNNQASDSQASGTEQTSGVPAQESERGEGPRVAWTSLLEPEIDQALEQGRITQEEYDEEMEYRRLAQERKHSKKRDLSNI